MGEGEKGRFALVGGHFKEFILLSEKISVKHGYVRS